MTSSLIRPMTTWSEEHLRQAKNALSRRGRNRQFYDVKEVDQFLANEMGAMKALKAQIDALQRENELLTQRAQDAEEGCEGAIQTLHAYTEKNPDAVLNPVAATAAYERAQQEADAVIADAEAFARERLADVEDQCDVLVAEAVRRSRTVGAMDEPEMKDNEEEFAENWAAWREAVMAYLDSRAKDVTDMFMTKIGRLQRAVQRIEPSGDE